ncbi:MAG: RagB/SusD family nutrient uptake outer membrane protein [Tannerella sp.]|nr:RagB/SusD family nutrient uptake outer membrane protein [Tannerella sp.]
MPNNKTELVMLVSATGLPSLHMCYDDLQIKWSAADDALGYDAAEYLSMENFGAINADQQIDIRHGWERCYEGINTNNNVINTYEKVTDMSEADLKALAAIAYFKRAYCYFYLVRFFNNVVLVLDSYRADFKHEMTLTPAREIYDLIISDLQFAEQWLPVTWKGSGYPWQNAAEPNKGIAKCVLAEVYLQMAGYPINGGTEYYARARDKAKEIIDGAETVYHYGMHEYFYQVWDMWKPGQVENEEYIWYTLHDPTYARSLRSPRPWRPAEYGGWSMIFPELGFYNRYPEGDRKEFMFITDFYHGPDAGHAEVYHHHYTDLAVQHPCYRKLWADDLVGEWKWENRNLPTSNWNIAMEARGDWQNGRSWPWIRYPEILLIYAETKARTDGPDALAYKCLNDVRNRAYKGLYTTEASVNGLSTEEFIDLVIWERAWEFAGFEICSRWWDLQRLELVEKANTEWRDEPDPRYAIQRSITKDDYFLPLPEFETQLNPNLGNNKP